MKRAVTGNKPTGKPQIAKAPAKPTRSYHTKKDKLLPTVVALKQAGFTPSEIVEQTGVSRNAVWKWLKTAGEIDKEYRSVKATIADQFAIAALDNLNLSARFTKHLLDISDDDLKDMNPVNVAALKRTADVAAGINHDHYRLESNQSTVNLGVLVTHIEAIQRGESEV